LNVNMLGVIIKGMRREYMEAYRRYNERYFKLPKLEIYFEYKEDWLERLTRILNKKLW